MARVAPDKADKHYDAIIVGSGATGGQAAYTLTMDGIRVLMLKAGRDYDPVTETAMMQVPSQAPLRATATPDKDLGFYDAAVSGSTAIAGEPYTNAPAEEPGAREVKWYRTRMLGGRSNQWRKVAMRSGPDDFRLKTLQGVGFDWPISYADLAPYYDKVEMLIGVCGEIDGIDNAPDSPPGVLLPAPALKLGERYTRKHLAKLGIPVTEADALSNATTAMPRQRAVSATHRFAGGNGSWFTPRCLRAGQPQHTRQWPRARRYPVYRRSPQGRPEVHHLLRAPAHHPARPRPCRLSLC